MNKDDKVPERVVDIFQEHSRLGRHDTIERVEIVPSIIINHQSDSKSPQTYRQAGRKCVEELGYAITGTRVINDGNGIQLWFDKIERDNRTNQTPTQENTT